MHPLFFFFLLTCLLEKDQNLLNKQRKNVLPSSMFYQNVLPSTMFYQLSALLKIS
jgi:hypothetical protein